MSVGSENALEILTYRSYYYLKVSKEGFRRTTVRKPPLINLPESDTEREENPVKMNNLTSCFTRRKAKKHESKPGVTYANIDMAASLKERVVFAWYLRNLEQKQFVKLELVSVTFCEAKDV